MVKGKASEIFNMAPVSEALKGLDELPPTLLEEREKNEDNEFNVDFSTKKKKKRSKNIEIGKSKNYNNGTADWPGYPYSELLDRIYDIFIENNPAIIEGLKKQFALKPPMIARVGTKKTAIVNFDEICKSFKRSNQNVCSYLLSELGTIGSVDANDHLIIKGRFLQKQIESILRKYCKEYVVCHTCKSFNTDLVKESRLLFLQCSSCNSKCSVQSIKTGFQAVTTKRKTIRV